MSWSTIKTEAIVLTIQPVHEADRRYSILTPTYGKMSVVGRGAQKQLAKLAAHLEPFAIVELEVVRGRRSTTVISVERRHIFRALSQNLRHRLLALSTLTMLDRYTQEQDQDETLYQMLVDWLAFLDQEIILENRTSALLLSSFMLRLMSRLGYKLELKYCLSCQQKIMPLSFRWHGGRGGLICDDCFEKNRSEWFAARNIDEGVIKLIRFCRERPYSDLLRLSVKNEEMRETMKIVQDLIDYHLSGFARVPFWSGILSENDLEVSQQSR